MRDMKFEIKNLEIVDEFYPISPLYFIEIIASSEEEAIGKFKNPHPLCIMTNINEIE